MGKLGVLGIGNTLRGDDGIGVVLVRRLKRQNFPETVDFYEAGISGINIPHYLKDLRKALIVDAINHEGEPGEAIFFKPEDIKSGTSGGTTHDQNILQAISLTKLLGEPPESVLIMGIVPEKMDLSEDFSEPLQKKLPQLENQLKEKIYELLQD